MSIGIGVLELVADCVLPALVSEVGSATVYHAAREVARTVLDSKPPISPQPTKPLYAVLATAILSETPGRARLGIVGLRGDYARARSVAARLEQLAGVKRACVNALTGNALVEYDPVRIDVTQIRAVLEPPRRRARRAAERCAAHDSRQLTLIGL
jgi:hypothetical protein